jgi:hypothetical protein
MMMPCLRIVEVAQVLAESKVQKVQTAAAHGRRHQEELTGDGGRSLDSRLDALARELAGAADARYVKPNA